LQEVAPKFLARGWPALWKNACTLDHLDTCYPVYPLYFSTESTQPERPEFNTPEWHRSKPTLSVGF